MLSVVMALVGCQAPGPTQIRESGSPVPLDDSPKSWAARVLNENPVILDARSPLDYNASHVPGALNAIWTDFTQVQSERRGLLMDDYRALTRRLALWGIHPGSSVLVLGNGREGQGEEGRIAWMLRFLGVRKVMTGSVRHFRMQNPRGPERPRNASYWNPRFEDGLALSLGEFQNLTMSRQGGKVVTKARAAALSLHVAPMPPVRERKAVILDVRSMQPESSRAEDWRRKILIPMHSMDWRFFFDEAGRPDRAVVAQLEALGVTREHEIYIVSEQGVESGAAAFALDQLRFGKPRNFVGGLKWLRSVRQKDFLRE